MTRNRRIAIRLEGDLLDRAERNASALGQTISSYIRFLIATSTAPAGARPVFDDPEPTVSIPTQSDRISPKPSLSSGAALLPSKCESCDLVIGPGVTTDFDSVYYGDDHEADICPRCQGQLWQGSSPNEKEDEDDEG